MNAFDFYTVVLEWILSHITDWNLYFIQSVATACALAWLIYRSCQTLWKPVPELINILGIEVPDPPEVALAGIQPTSITLYWSKPLVNKPVAKYLIQVNGVIVGDSTRLETAITVTGLKPGHYYNVSVIAVGTSHFSAASPVLRLSTLGRNGRPRLEGDSSEPSDDEHDDADKCDDVGEGRRNAVGIEAATLPETSQAMIREQSSGTGQRRNTVGRKHSQSIAGADQPVREPVTPSVPGESMNQLAEKFEGVRKETDEVMAQIAKEEEEFQVTLAIYVRDRDERKQTLKEKDEVSTKLKNDAVACERQNRQAQNQKKAKEEALSRTEAAREKRTKDMARWEKEIDQMRLEREEWKRNQEEFLETTKTEALTYKTESGNLQQKLRGIEDEIHLKGLQIKALEAERSQLPVTQNGAEYKEQDDHDKLEDLQWESAEKDFLEKLHHSSMQLQEIGTLILQNRTHLSILQANSPIMYHPNTSGQDFDPNGGAIKPKSRRTRNRKSRTNTVSSSGPGYPMNDPQFPGAHAYNGLQTTLSPNFAPGPYIDMNNDTAMVPLSEQMHGLSDEDVRMLTAGAPLSPTATSLLPSNIFMDDDPPSSGADSIRSGGLAMYGGDPHSPHSSSRSASHMSSPQNSAHNLALYGVTSYAGENERRSLNSPRTDYGVIGSAALNEPTPHKGIRDLFTLPSRARGKTTQEDGPALGSLKHGQSQSFPRALEEPETLANRARRMSFTSNWPGFGRRGTADATIEGNAPAPARNIGARRRRGFNMFNNSMDENSVHSERDPSSPRPVSIASSGPGELPRPSTDSAPFGWGAPGPDALLNRNSPLATNWSINAPPTWSRNPSRRPSIQHGSTTALTTGIASDDDEFLPPSDSLVGHASPPASVGVIGTRPVSSHKPVTPKLNPAAPAFKGFSFRGSNADKEKDKSKGKTKVKPIDVMDEIVQAHSTSPTASRKSKDTPSIHTQNSITESYESLDTTPSNPTSDATPGPSTKEKESASSLRDLLRRKGSSSKFSLPNFRNITGKKGTSSAANSDRNASVERDGSFDEYSEDAGLGRSVDSVTSSPMIGSNASGEWKPNTKENIPIPKEGRMSRSWSRFVKKGGAGKGRESLDVERSESELTTEDEGNGLVGGDGVYVE